MDNANKKNGVASNGETWHETPGGIFRVYTVGGSVMHTELCVRRKDLEGRASWEPHYRNPCEGQFFAVFKEAVRRERAIEANR